VVSVGVVAIIGSVAIRVASLGVGGIVITAAGTGVAVIPEKTVMEKEHEW